MRVRLICVVKTESTIPYEMEMTEEIFQKIRQSTSLSSGHSSSISHIILLERMSEHISDLLLDRHRNWSNLRTLESTHAVIGTLPQIQDSCGTPEEISMWDVWLGPARYLLQPPASSRVPSNC